MVQAASEFPFVVVEFFEFVDGLVDNFGSQASTTIEKIILVVHNGRFFDVHFSCACWRGIGYSGCGPIPATDI